MTITSADIVERVFVRDVPDVIEVSSLPPITDRVFVDQDTPDVIQIQSGYVVLPSLLASDVIYDPTGNLIMTSPTMQGALDQAEIALQNSAVPSISILTDVDVSGGLSENDVLSWNTGSGKWIPTNIATQAEFDSLSETVSDLGTSLASDFVTLTTSQTITGAKTFTSAVHADVLRSGDLSSPQAAYLYVKNNHGGIPTAILQNHASQSGNILEFQSSANAMLARVDALGNAYFAGASQVGGSQVVTAANIGTYAPAPDLTPYVTLATAQTITGLKTIQSSIWSNPGLIIKGAPSQVADLLRLTDSDNNVLARSDQFGNITATSFRSGSVTYGSASAGGSTTNFSILGDPLLLKVGGSNLTAASLDTNTALTVTGVSAASPTLKVKAAASQTANLLELQNSAGTVLSRFASDGVLYLPNGGLEISGGIFQKSGSNPFYMNSNLRINSGTPTIEFGGGAGVAGDTNLYRSAADVLQTDDEFRAPAVRVATGMFGGQTQQVANFINTSGIFIQPSNASTMPVYIRGLASQTANLTEWQNSAGTVLASFTSAGELKIGVSSRILFDGPGAGVQDSISFHSANRLQAGGHWYANFDITARIGGTHQTSIGQMGPANESGIKFGLAGDTNLYRSAANVLKTDDDFTANTFTSNPLTNQPGLVINSASGNDFTLLSMKRFGGTSAFHFGLAGQATHFLPDALQGDMSLRLDSSNANSRILIGTDDGSGTNYPSTLRIGNGFVHVASRNAATTPLYVDGAASQTADLQLWRDSAGSQRASVAANGRISNSDQIRAGTSVFAWAGNAIESKLGDAGPGQEPGILLGQAGDTNLYRSAANTLKTDDLFIAGANLRVGASTSGLSANGNALQILANDATYQFSGSPTMQGLGGGFVFIAPNASDIPLAIRGAASQTGNLQEWRNSAGTMLARVTAAGGATFSSDVNITTGGALDASLGAWHGIGGHRDGNVALMVRPNANNTVPLRVKRLVGTTVNIQEWTQDDGTVLARINSVGRGHFDGLRLQHIDPFDGTDLLEVWNPTGTTKQLAISNSGELTVATIAGLNTLSLAQTQFQGGDQLSVTAYGGGSAFFSVNAANLAVGGGGAGELGLTGRARFLAGQPDRVPLTVKGAASQTGNLQEWYNSAGSVLAQINASGTFTTNTGSVNTGGAGQFSWGGESAIVRNGSNGTLTWSLQGGVGINNGLHIRVQDSASMVRIQSTLASTATPTLVVQAAATQTANIQEWRSSVDMVLSKIDSGGRFIAGTTIYGSTGMQITNSGGSVYTNVTGTNSGLTIGGNGTLPLDITGTTRVNTGAAVNIGMIVKANAGQTANLQEWQGSTGTALAYFANDGRLHVNDIRGTGGGVNVNDAFQSTGMLTTSGGIRIPSGVTVDFRAVLSKSDGGTSPLTISPTQSAQIGLLVKGVDSQTADLQQWQDSLGGVAARVTAGGGLALQNALYLNTAYYLSNTSGAPTSGAIFHTSADGNYWSVTRSGVQDVLGVGSGASKIGLYVKGYTSQTADLQQWQNSAGSILTRIAASGHITVPGGSAGLASASAQLSLAGSNGQVNLGSTSVAAMSVTAQPGAGSAAALVDSYAANNAAITLAIRKHSTQTGDMTQWQDAGGGVLAAVGADGRIGSPYFIGPSLTGPYINIAASVITLSTATNVAGAFKATASGAADIVSTFKGASSQTGDLTQWQNSAGTALAKIDNAGSLTAFGGLFNSALYVASAFQAANSVWNAIGDQSFRSGAQTLLVHNGTSSAVIPLVTRSAYANHQITSAQKTSNVVTVVTASAHNLATGRRFYMFTGNASFDGNFTVTSVPTSTSFTYSFSGADVGLTNFFNQWFGRSDTQTANIQEWQNGTGEVVARIDKDGALSFPMFGGTVSKITSTNAQTLDFVTVQGTATINRPGVGDFYIPMGVTSLARSASAEAIIAKGASGQTANLTEWRNSADTVLARVSSGGSIFSGTSSFDTNGFYTSGDYVARNYAVIIGSMQPQRGAGAGHGIAIGTGSDLRAVLAYESGSFGADRLVLAGRAAGNQANVGFDIQGNGKSATITNKSLTANVATLTTSANHGFTAGKRVLISGVDATFNGTYTIASTPTTTTFTYAKTAADVASTASGGTAWADVQTANLQQWMNVAGEVLASIDYSGKIASGQPTGAANPISGVLDLGNWRVTGDNQQNMSLDLIGGAFVAPAFRIRNLILGGASVPGVGGYSNSYGTLSFNTGSGVLASVFQVNNAATGNIVLGVKGNAGQTADLVQLQSSAGTVLAKIAADGRATFPNWFVGSSAPSSPVLNDVWIDTSV